MKTESLKNQNPDDDALAVWDNINAFYDYLQAAFNRDSYDAEGGKMTAYVNVDLGKCPNGAWVPATRSVLLCDGYAEGMDIIAHEYGHGIINDEADLDYVGGMASESGALNESYADLFAVFIDPSNPWKISFDDAATNLIRNLANPPSLKDFPDHYSDLVAPGEHDECQVKKDEGKSYGCAHVNSTIHSKAYHLLATGGAHHGITVAAIGMDKVEQIVYHSLADGGLAENSDFRQARETAIRTCQRLIGWHGIITGDCAELMNAYAAVGIGEPAPQGIPTPIAPPVPTGHATTQPTRQPEFTITSSATVLVLDTSGSMGNPDSAGVVKLQGAIQAGSNLLDVIEAENDMSGVEHPHEVGLISFDDYARIGHDMTGDISVVYNALDELYPGGGTGMAEGLNLAIEMLSQDSSPGMKMIVLLSDGMPNIPLNGTSSSLYNDDDAVKTEVLDLASRAGSSGLCIHTIGFGDPQGSGDNWIDEDFLRNVAAASGCGAYYYAQDAYQLADVFIDLRHQSMGAIQLQYSGTIANNQDIDLGSANITGVQDMLLFTLNWADGVLEPVLSDPGGRRVDDTYPGVNISESSNTASIIISNPMTGQWQVGAQGRNIPQGSTHFHAVLSSRGVPVSSRPANGLWLFFILLLVAAIGIPLYLSHGGSRRGVINGKQGASLVIQTPGGSRQIIPLQSITTIGRHHTNTIALRDPSASRRHASIRRTRSGWLIQDEGSRYGLVVNDQRVKQVYLKDGDRIVIGRTTLVFRVK